MSVRSITLQSRRNDSAVLDEVRSYSAAACHIVFVVYMKIYNKKSLQLKSVPDKAASLEGLLRN